MKNPRKAGAAQRIEDSHLPAPPTSPCDRARRLVDQWSRASAVDPFRTFGAGTLHRLTL